MAQPGRVSSVEFTLAGAPCPALIGGQHVTLDEAISVSVSAEDQAETDRMREALIADGSSESRCGWLKDRFGLSWQIVPKRSVGLVRGPKAAKVWPALLPMRKINIAALEDAAEHA